MRNGFRLYDTHTHIGAALHSGRRTTAEQLLAGMDAVGVDRSLAIPFPVVDNHRAAHDEIARAVRAWPDRLRGCICLPPFLPRQEFRDELRRCVEHHGFRALKLQPQYHGLNPLSARHQFFFELAAEHSLTIVAHTGSGVPFALPSLFMAPAKRLPELRIVLGHAGGSVYYQECIVAALLCPNVYIEVSSLAPHHVLDILGHVGAERLMAGSDLPESTAAEMGKIVDLEIPAEAKRQILWETAERLFG